MNRKAFRLFALLFFSLHIHIQAQPTGTSEGTRFHFQSAQARSVSLLGDFNGWSPSANPMTKDAEGKWIATKKLRPGVYQYCFLVDGARVTTDPSNEVSIHDPERQEMHSLFSVSQDGGVSLQGYPERLRMNDDYQKTGGTVFLNIVWRFHQPSYYNAEKDYIAAPFVRIHGTKDYYDMIATVERYPNVHVTSALSASTLWQIEQVYVKRIKPYVKKKSKVSELDAYGFQARYRGKTDPWIDLCLKSAASFTDEDKKMLYQHAWNGLTMSRVQMSRFPELLALFEKWNDAKGAPAFTDQDIRSLKFWAVFAHFDPEFYERKIPLPNNTFVDFRDLVSFRSDGKYYLKKEVEESDCQRIIADVCKVMQSIVPKYQKIKYNPRTKAGQVELAGSSYFDAVLPLIGSTDVARGTATLLPATFAHPDDAEAQMQLALQAYNEMLGIVPRGYVPPKGTIAKNEIALLNKIGYKWFTSDQEVLAKSEPSGANATAPYGVTEGTESTIAAFGDAELANRVNFVYRNYYAENAADDFIRSILSMAPQNVNEETFLTVVIDGDQPWSWYQNDIDGQGFVNGLYRKLEKIFKTRAIVTATLSEYIDGNPDRGIKAHPLSSLKAITQLGAGSQINGNFNAWIGDKNANTAWEYLTKTRNDLTTAGITAPAVDVATLREGSKEWFAARAYISYLAAQSNDWFAAFGNEFSLRSNPKPFETIFLNHLRNAYALAQRAGAAITAPTFESFAGGAELVTDISSIKKKTRVTFHCQLKDREAITAVYVAGNRTELADSQPNTKALRDNGEYGDVVSGDNTWTLIVDIDQGPLIYKYTNSGGKGTWEGSEAFPDVWRHIDIVGDKMTIDDVFGQITKK